MVVEVSLIQLSFIFHESQKKFLICIKCVKYSIPSLWLHSWLSFIITLEISNLYQMCPCKSTIL
jgi:hypothetical protein